MKSRFCFLFAIIAHFFCYNLMAQWTTISSGTNEILRSIYFISPTSGFIVGDRGTYLKTTNGGDIWQHLILLDNSNWMNQIFFSDNSHGWIVSNSYILSTTNSGESWNVQYTRPTTYPQFQPRSVYFFDNNVGFVVGTKLNDDNSGPISLLKTTNGGSLWIEIYVGSGSPQIPQKIVFQNNDVGYIGGETNLHNYLFMRTTDGGYSWNSIPNVHFSIRSREDITIYNNTVFTGGSAYSGYYSKIMKSSNGTNWSAIDINASIINCLCFTSVNSGWAGSSGGNIFHSTDFGETWNIAASSTNNSYFKDIFFANSNLGWACGSNGLIMKYNNAVSVDVSNNDFPQTYYLKQCYPNPYNSSTTISYATPKQSYVELKVFNIFGEEVAALVNEEKGIGNYQITINASSLPSGVYFYQLKAGSFVETRKMILLK